MVTAEKEREINEIVKTFDKKIAGIVLVLMIFGFIGGLNVGIKLSEWLTVNTSWHATIVSFLGLIPFLSAWWLYEQTLKYYKSYVEAEYRSYQLEKELRVTQSLLDLLRDSASKADEKD